MSFEVKGAEAHELSREHNDTQLRAEALLAIGQDTAPRLREPDRGVAHGELLYDDKGLPR